jgi:hypothetical protein
MSSENEIPNSVQSTLDAMRGKKKESYGLVGRVTFFLIVAVIGSAIAFGLWIRFGIGAAMTAGGGGGSSALPLILFIWLGGLIAAGVATFKR